MDIVKQELSKEANVEVKFEGNKVKLSFKYEGNGAGAEVTGFVSSDYLLDQLAKAIPGQIDDAIIAIAKSALNKL
jgi:hypothetical protein